MSDNNNDDEDDGGANIDRFDEDELDNVRRAMLVDTLYQQLLLGDLRNFIDVKCDGDIPSGIIKRLQELLSTARVSSHRASEQFTLLVDSSGWGDRDAVWIEENGNPRQQAEGKIKSFVSSLEENTLGVDDSDSQASISRDSNCIGSRSTDVPKSDNEDERLIASTTDNLLSQYSQQEQEDTELVIMLNQDESSTTLGSEDGDYEKMPYIGDSGNDSDGGEDDEGKINSFMSLGDDAVSHCEVSQQINLANTERIKAEYIDMGQSGANRHYTLCQFDMGTVIIQTILDSFFSCVDLKQLEIKMSLLPALLETNTSVAFQSKLKAIERLEKKFGSVQSCGLSYTLRAIDCNAPASVGQGNIDGVSIVEAAKRATEKHDLLTSGGDKAQEKSTQEQSHDGDKSSDANARSWSEHSTLQKHDKNATLLALLIFAGVRVLKQITFGEFVKEVEEALREKINKEYEFFCNSVIGDGEVGSCTLAQLVEKVIIPSVLGDGTSVVEEDCVKALELLKLITTELCTIQWKDYFAKAEAVPLERLYDTCSEDEINQYLLELEQAGQDARYLSETKDSISQPRRRRTMRAIYYLLQSPVVAQTMVSKGLLSELDASHFSFALLCSPSSHFSNLKPSGFHFFQDARFVRASNGSCGDKVKGSVEKMFTRMCSAMETFRNDHIYANLTGDLETENILRLFSNFSVYPSRSGDDEHEHGDDDDDDDESSS